MTSAPEGKIPCFSADVIRELPLFYRAMAEYLAETGRAVIVSSEKDRQNTA